MNYDRKAFMWFLHVGFAGIALIFFGCANPVSEEEYLGYRMDQLHKENFSKQGSVLIYNDSTEAYLEDYFSLEDDGYMYEGGLFSPLMIDSIYDPEQVMGAATRESGPNFINFGWEADQKVYINVDRIEKGTVKEYLKKLDVYEKMVFGELWIDLRFNRSADFGSLIQLCNQWCNRKDFELATVVGQIRKDEINASGNPFFDADRFYFILSDHTPEVVRKLVVNLSRLDEYNVKGDFSLPADTVCIRNRFRMEDRKIVDICNKLLVCNSLPNGHQILTGHGKGQYNWKEEESRFHNLYYTDTKGDPEALKKCIGRLVSNEN